jgi:hypothetical protein
MSAATPSARVDEMESARTEWGKCCQVERKSDDERRDDDAKERLRPPHPKWGEASVRRMTLTGESANPRGWRGRSRASAGCWGGKAELGESRAATAPAWNLRWGGMATWQVAEKFSLPAKGLERTKRGWSNRVKAGRAKANHWTRPVAERRSLTEMEGA